MQATFAAGCFWGVEARFQKVIGVVDTEVGYTGGSVEDPTYAMVCTGTTGHAEAVRLEFDPGVITYQELLQIFFEMHDPRQKDRQGPDVGGQYRSAIFFHDEEQEREALEAKEKQGEGVVTQIVPAGDFYRAEEYHQCYHQKFK